MKESTIAISIAVALSLPLAAVAQMSLSLNQSSTGSGTGAWTTLPSCAGPGNALTFDSAKQEFGCTALPQPGVLTGGEHLVIGGATPTAVAGSGAGNSPQLRLAANSTDSAGWIELTTGSSPEKSAAIATVTAAAPAAPGDSWNCGIAAANGAAAALNDNQAPYIPAPAIPPPGSVPASAAPTAFTLMAGSQKLAASTEYVWRYWCVELK